MAPEILMAKRYNEKVDVYSFGMLLYEMVSGKLPYAGMVRTGKKDNVVGSRWRRIEPTSSDHEGNDRAKEARHSTHLSCSSEKNDYFMLGSRPKCKWKILNLPL